MIKLYGSQVSPFVRHCCIALRQTNTDYEFEPLSTTDCKDKTPTARIPFMTDGDLRLHDSSVIIRYARENSGESYLPTIADQELFCLATTILDTAVNLFFLELTDFNLSENKYTIRQQKRIENGLIALNNYDFSPPDFHNDAILRTLCLLDWAIMRNRITIAHCEQLQLLRQLAEQDTILVETKPTEPA